MFDLAPYNTFGLHVFARKGIIVHSPADLAGFGDELYMILGHGSDVLLTEDFEGTVLINAIRGLEITSDKDCYQVRVGGGEILDDIIVKLLRKGITGLENLSQIPGTMGAAPIQNVGAYGVEIGDFIEKIEVYNLQTRTLEYYSKEDCQFSYRSSVFKLKNLRHLFITNVFLKLDKNRVPTLSYGGLDDSDLKDAVAVRRKVIELRSRKLPDPRFVGNAGSFFKNPLVSAEMLKALRERYPNIPTFVQGDQYKVAAGFLIDQAGLKGVIHGNAGTWEHQALVLVNRGDAKPHEILSLAKYIVSRVYDMFGVELEPEVRIFGSTGELKWQEI